MAELQRIAALDDIPAGGVLAVEVDGVDVALVRTDDEVFAIHDECSHASVALSEGEVEGCEIECWLHGSMFDLRTGSVDIYPCKVDDGAVYVDVHSPLNAQNTDQES